MRTLILALATSATVFATGVTEVAAGDYRYCIEGADFPGGAGDQTRGSVGLAGISLLFEGINHRRCGSYQANDHWIERTCRIVF